MLKQALDVSLLHLIHHWQFNFTLSLFIYPTWRSARDGLGNYCTNTKYIADVQYNMMNTS